MLGGPSPNANALTSKMYELNVAAKAASGNAQAAIAALLIATAADGAAAAAMTAATPHKTMIPETLYASNGAARAVETRSNESPTAQISQAERFRIYFPNPFGS